MIDHYLLTSVYDQLVAELVKPTPCELDRPSYVKTILGEIGGIWPEHVRPAEPEPVTTAAEFIKRMEAKHRREGVAHPGAHLTAAEEAGILGDLDLLL
ncbi:hypothetical protein C5F48_18110 [Cereibacter changlensis JA139]|uniref:Uncharacterized protein n=2 Tax=Cereibacter changlensis TaxID=402884 RepID=A0A2T4JQZ3_9RHOB|nr:hypothetical protein [Cereibacter changlensis]PTE20332.1 hypothetical protein C5F48_18110 [Cereibacter changlensis JA139]PZX48807.1 hypothetical protein LX76_04068 [Cereibacter changlensis]